MMEMSMVAEGYYATVLYKPNHGAKTLLSMLFTKYYMKVKMLKQFKKTTDKLD
jgi:hypothetical protein